MFDDQKPKPATAPSSTSEPKGRQVTGCTARPAPGTADFRYHRCRPCRRMPQNHPFFQVLECFKALTGGELNFHIPIHFQTTKIIKCSDGLKIVFPVFLISRHHRTPPELQRFRSTRSCRFFPLRPRRDGIPPALWWPMSKSSKVDPSIFIFPVGSTLKENDT